MHLIRGKVKRIYKTYALVETELGLGICHISNFSDFKINNLSRFIQIYNPCQFAVISKKANDCEHPLDLSFKAIRRCFCQCKLKLEHDASGFSRLRKFVHYAALKKWNEIQQKNLEESSLLKEQIASKEQAENCG